MHHQTKVEILPLRLHSRVRVISVRIGASDSSSQRYSLLKCLDTTGTVVGFDPRFTLPWRVKLDDGNFAVFAEENLKALEPGKTATPKSDALAALVLAIGRHEPMANDPAVIDAINAIEKALTGEPT